MRRPLHAPLAAFTVLFVVSGCGDSKKNAEGSAAASASSDAPKTQEIPPPKPKTMPELLVDSMGPYLNGQRVDLTKQDGLDRLVKIVKELPIEGKPVTLIADKKAKTPHVAIVVSELGLAGAPKITIKTDGRNDLPKEITVTPDSRVSNPPGCSVATMVMKDLSTAVWPLKGGLGKRHRKGFAGPDLSHTGESLKRDLAACNSTTAFFSGDDTVIWEMTYNLAGTVLVSDEKKKIDALVLPREIPVAGRALVIGK